MDHHSLLHQSKTSLSFPSRGMELVVATVSGYHGTDRFNLIKLISHSGASYVGNMNRSITHLVCWKFEGQKYDLAKKFKAIVVNHRWVEDCIKKGRRLPEHPYTNQCGEEVGSLRLDISLIAVKPISKQFNSCNDSKEQAVDLDSEDSACIRWTDSTLLNKNLPAERSQNTHRVKRKASTSNSRQDGLCSGRYFFDDLPLYGSSRMELPEAIFQAVFVPNFNGKLIFGPLLDFVQQQEEVNTPEPLLKPKRSSASGEPSRRMRRLLKGNASGDIFDFTLNPEQEFCQAENFNEHHGCIATTRNDLQRHGSTLDLRRPNIILDDSEEIEYINNVLDDKDQNLSANGSLSPIRNLQECHSSDAELNDIEHNARLSTPTELSCVICWTDFSSTRGLLDCGHRFCFSCIESWSYHLRSVGKDATCPLCKVRYEKITRVDDAATSDQNVYSQTIPLDRLGKEVYILPEGKPPASSANASTASTCCKCFCQEPEDLLERCHLCQMRSVHIYCLDPPLFPWTCDSCKDLQMLYRHNL